MNPERHPPGRSACLESGEMHVARHPWQLRRVLPAADFRWTRRRQRRPAVLLAGCEAGRYATSVPMGIDGCDARQVAWRVGLHAI